MPGSATCSGAQSLGSCTIASSERAVAFWALSVAMSRCQRAARTTRCRGLPRNRPSGQHPTRNTLWLRAVTGPPVRGRRIAEVSWRLVPRKAPEENLTRIRSGNSGWRLSGQERGAHAVVAGHTESPGLCAPFSGDRRQPAAFRAGWAVTEKRAGVVHGDALAIARSGTGFPVPRGHSGGQARGTMDLLGLVRRVLHDVGAKRRDPRLPERGSVRLPDEPHRKQLLDGGLDGPTFGESRLQRRPQCRP